MKQEEKKKLLVIAPARENQLTFSLFPLSITYGQVYIAETRL